MNFRALRRDLNRCPELAANCALSGLLALFQTAQLAIIIERFAAAAPLRMKTGIDLVMVRESRPKRR